MINSDIKFKDIARLANVSPATVSLVINNRQGVSRQTREKVLSILSSQGYVANTPDTPSTSEVGRKSIRFLKYKKHGKVVDENGFISALIDGVNIEAGLHGYNVIMTTLYDGDVKSAVRVMQEDPGEGVILLGTELGSEDIAFLKDIHVPVVIVDSYFEFDDYDCVVMNNVDATYKAVKYLYNLGYTEIGHLQSSIIINNFTARREGYLKALKNCMLPHVPEFTFTLESTLDGAYQGMKKLLAEQPKLPLAMFADNDTIAIGAMKALKEHGYRIPEDISIIGFDDIPFCLINDPPLTTIRIPKEYIGACGVRRLVEKMEKKDGTIAKIQVGAELVERKSTMPAKLHTSR